MKKVGPDPRPGLRIRRIFEPDPVRAAAALAQLLAAEPVETASDPGGDSTIDASHALRCEDGPRPRRASARQTTGHQRHHPDRLLGPTWWEPDAPLGTRRSWPLSHVTALCDSADHRWRADFGYGRAGPRRSSNSAPLPRRTNPSRQRQKPLVLQESEGNHVL